MTARTGRPLVLRRPHLALMLAAEHAPGGVLSSRGNFDMDTAAPLLDKDVEFLETEDTVYRQPYGLGTRITNTLLRVSLTEAGRLRLKVELAHLEDHDPDVYAELTRYYPAMAVA